MRKTAVNDFNHALNMFVKGAQEMINTYYAKNFQNLIPSVLKVSEGRRYVKITAFRDGGKGSGSVWAFIDKKEGFEGNIMKPASWRTPAKHARGSIFDGEWGIKSVGPHGPAYLK